MTLLGIILSLVFTLVLPPVLPGVVKSESVSLQLPVPASVPTLSVAQPEITAQAFGVWDPGTATMLAQQHADELHSIASLTKLMTALVVLEQSSDLEQLVTITEEDNDPEGSRVLIPAGGVVTVRGLLGATLIGSANNATEALVRSTGIQEAAFVALMNGRARDLGMAATTFTDVTGLGVRNRSTVHDLVILMGHVFQEPLIRELTTMPDYSVQLQSGDVAPIKNTNQLVGTDLRILAGKTGYTEAAGGCLVSRIKGIGEHELVFIVLGSYNQQDRFSDTRTLADWAFANTQWQ